MKKIVVLLVSLALVSTLLFASGAQEEVSEKSYVFGSDCTWPPLEFVDENNEIVGFEIDLIKAISENSGVPMSVRNVAWEGIFAGLANGAYDAVASGVTILEERKAIMDFTTPILEVTQAIVVQKSSAPIADEKGLVYCPNDI